MGTRGSGETRGAPIIQETADLTGKGPTSDEPGEGKGQPLIKKPIPLIVTQTSELSKIKKLFGSSTVGLAGGPDSRFTQRSGWVGPLKNAIEILGPQDVGSFTFAGQLSHGVDVFRNTYEARKY